MFCTSYYLYARAFDYQAHTHQLDFLKSEGLETSAQEYSSRRIRFFRVHFGLDFIWKIIPRKEAKNWSHKNEPKRLDSSRCELSVRGLGFVVAILICLRIELGEQSSSNLFLGILRKTTSLRSLLCSLSFWTDALMMGLEYGVLTPTL